MPLNNKKITRRNFLKFSFAGLALIAAGNFISAARPVFAQYAVSNGPTVGSADLDKADIAVLNSRLA